MLNSTRKKNHNTKKVNNQEYIIWHFCVHLELRPVLDFFNMFDLVSMYLGIEIPNPGISAVFSILKSQD